MLDALLSDGAGKTLFERDAEFVKGLHQLRVNVIHTLRTAILLAYRRVSIVGDSLIVNLWKIDMSPRWLLLSEPVAISIKTELEEPFRFTLLLRDETYHIFVEPFIYYFCLYICGEAELILLLRHVPYKLIRFTHS